ncbi:MAG: DUF6150 family protein [Candidatus Cyclobacteriaceae bacterium M3_2C_046]
MKQLLWLILLLLVPAGKLTAHYPHQDICNLYGSVYIESEQQFADYYVYLEETEAFADLVVFKEENKLFADRSGLWHFSENKGFADFSIFFVNHKGQADFSIAYTDANVFAGCN